MENIGSTDRLPDKMDESNKHSTLTFKEAWNEIFGRAISKDKLYSEIRAGRIPHIKIGTKILFRRVTLEAWLREQEYNNYTTKHISNKSLTSGK